MAENKVNKPQQKKGVALWWSNLGKGAKTAICILGGVAAATAVAVPTVIAVKGCSSNISVELADGTTGIKIDSKKKLDSGDLQITLKLDEGKELKSVDKITYGNEELKLNEHYVLDGTIITINKDVVNAHKNDKVIIAVTVKDKKPEVIPVTGVTVKSSTTIEVNKTETLVATVAPSDATNKNVSWSSDKTSVATVNATTGLVTAVAEGTANITVTTEDGGFTDTCVVTVPSQQKYTLKLVTNQPEGVSVPTTLTGGGTYTSGTTVTIKATSAEPTFEFLGWYDGDTKLSDNLEFSYDTGSSNKTLIAAFDDKNFESCTWKRISDKCTALENGDIDESKFLSSFIVNGSVPNSMDDFIGVIRESNAEVPIGGHGLISRVIGVQHGKDENEEGKTDFIIENGKVTKKVATFTFDSYELVSDDDDEYSLAYQWNDPVTESALSSAQDYPNSSLRKVLCGSGNHNTPVYASSYGALSKSGWDKDYTYQTESDSILARMPEDFTKLLKTVKKTCRTGSDLETVSDCSDKLFILSVTEMGGSLENDEGLAYSFYTGDKIYRVKHQCSPTIVSTEPTDTNITARDQQYQGDITSYAGINKKERDPSYVGSEGGYYWTRSASNSAEAYCVIPDGSVGPRTKGSASSKTCFDNACAISVAFCI